MLYKEPKGHAGVKVKLWCVKLKVKVNHLNSTWVKVLKYLKYQKDKEK